MYIQKLERFEKFKQPENKREEGKFRIRCMGRVGNIWRYQKYNWKLKLKDKSRKKSEDICNEKCR